MGFERVRTITAAELAAVIGVLDIDGVAAVAPDLARAVSQLTAAAEREPLVDVDDPLVTQVRALALLSIAHPSATSSAAAEIVDRLAAPSSQCGEQPGDGQYRAPFTSPPSTWRFAPVR